MQRPIFLVLGVLAVLFVPNTAHAQEKSTGADQLRSVPFVGCKSDGQVGPREAPQGQNVMLRVSAKEAELLAYYKADLWVGVLAPRGWDCFGVSGSGGTTLYITPSPINVKGLFPPKREALKGPMILVSYIHGSSSGRFLVAAMIARVFPERKAFLDRIIEELDVQRTHFPAGPYPGDSMIYKGPTQLEYTTPAYTEGLGTWRMLAKDSSPIHGAAVLVGGTPDLAHLGVRLPADLASPTPIIIGNFVVETARRP